MNEMEKIKQLREIGVETDEKAKKLLELSSGNVDIAAEKFLLQKDNENQDHKKPVDMEYYDILGIPFTATQPEIKKGYYKVAIKYHPDKNPGNPEAEEKFKKISEAYQILSNPELKEKYDKFGKDGLQNSENIIDPKVFFTMIFGGPKFEELIGELAIASMAEEESETQREKLREERITKLCTNLKNRLQVFVDGNINKFMETSRSTAEELKKESFGLELIHTLGYIYLQKSKQYIGQNEFFGIGGMFHGFKEKVHLVQEAFSTVSTAMEIKKIGDEIEKQEKIGKLSDEKKMEYQKKAVVKGVEAMWKMNKLDIEGTIRVVCEKVLNDQSIDKKIRLSRAQALDYLGTIFLKTEGDLFKFPELM